MNSVRLAAIVLAGTGAVLTAQAAMPGDGTFAAAQLLRDAKTYYLEIEQSYLNAPDTSLPFTDAAHALLRSAGMTEATVDDSDVIIRVVAEGRALTRRYNNTQLGVAVEHFSGAEISGWFTLAARGRSVRAEFVGRREPPLHINQTYSEPSQAPYAAAFSGFVNSLARTVTLAHGPQPMIALLRASDSEDYFYTVPQLQASAAAELARSGSSEAKTILLEALQSFSPHRQAGAAHGLRILGDSSVLPSLIAALNTVEGALPVDLENDGRWQVMTHPQRAFDSSENDAGFLEPWPELLNAISSFEGDKTGPLLAVMRNPDAPLARMGAALLLGRERGPKAYDVLLNTAKTDSHVLVRLAAVSALGELRDQRAVAELQAIARQSTVTVQEKMTVRRALERLEPAAIAGNTDN
jgi:hypothetical protein